MGLHHFFFDKIVVKSREKRTYLVPWTFWNRVEVVLEWDQRKSKGNPLQIQNHCMVERFLMGYFLVLVRPGLVGSWIFRRHTWNCSTIWWIRHKKQVSMVWNRHFTGIQERPNNLPSPNIDDITNLEICIGVVVLKTRLSLISTTVWSILYDLFYLVEGASFERIKQMTWAANIQNSSISFNTGLMESMSLSWELATSDKDGDSVTASIWTNDITDFNGIITKKVMKHHFTDFTFFISIIINTTIIPVASELKIWFKVLLFECYKNLLSKLDDHGPKIASRYQYVP